MKRAITTYLDANATTPAYARVIDVMAEVMKEPSNASSVHGAGRAARAKLEEARAELCKLVNASSADVVFTGSGTEANNLILKSELAEVLIVSSIEHASVLKTAKVQGATLIGVDENGVIKTKELQSALENLGGKRALVSVMLANNETGVIQPIREVVDITLAHRGFVHVDATQAIGKITVEFDALGADAITLSGHKFGGPQGVGAVIFKKGLALKAQVTGGGQERSLRAGTENVAGICGIAEAARIVRERGVLKADLRDAIERELVEAGGIIFGAKVARLPNTICVALPGMKADTQLIAMDLEGIAVSSGSACSSGRVEASHVLAAMGVEKHLAESALRISLLESSTEADAKRVVEVWKTLKARVAMATKNAA